MLAVDNDSLTATRDDGGYTSGIRLSVNPAPGSPLLPGERALAQALASALPARCARDGDADAALGGWFLEQSIYTPQALDVADPQPDDRPWAGWLQLGRTLDVVSVGDGGRAIARRVHWAIGRVGAGSYAEPSQRAVHRWLGFQAPMGWPTQLRDRTSVALGALERRRWGAAQRDAIVHWGAVAGNVQSYAQAGATLRVGRGLCDLSVPGTLVDHLRTSGALGGAGCGGDTAGTLYAFAGVEVRAKARDELLEGARREGANAISVRRGVADLRIGVATAVGRWMLTYTFTRRSAEFDSPAGLGRPQNFAAVVLSR